jgi:hypothetical protein
MGLMDDVQKNVQTMDENAIREALTKIQVQRAKQKENQKAKLANLTPEQKEERKAKQKLYRDKVGDKFIEKRKEYNKRPDVKAKRQAYMKKRNAERTAIMRRAKELGIVP